jgi:tetratricopeptide (TPR) repeat protein
VVPRVVRCWIAPFVLCAGVIVCSLPTRASAQEPSDPAVRLAQGEALFDAGNYLAALAEFQRAYDQLEGNPDRFLVLFNIGQSHERLFHYDEALTFYQRYLDEGGADAEGAADVRASMRALEGLLGTLVIAANVESTVWIDGHQIGTAPGVVHVPGGRHDVQLRAPGHLPSEQEIQVAARERVEVSFTLAVLSDYDGIEPTYFWITLASAAAVLVVGAGVGIGALVESGEGQRRASMSPILNTPADAAYVANLALAADVLYLAGTAIAVGAVVLAFLTDWDGPRRTDGSTASLRWTPLVSPSLVGFAARLEL